MPELETLGFFVRSLFRGQEAEGDARVDVVSVRVNAQHVA